MSNPLFGGFHAVDALRQTARRYEVASGYATNIFGGDMMTLLTDGTVAVATAGASDDTILLLGVCRDVSYMLNGVRVVNTYLPASTTYSPTSRGARTASYVWVYDDPNTEYHVCLASHANTNTEAKIWAAVGSNMDFLATAGNTVYRQSGHTLDGNPIAGAAQLRIESIVRRPGRDLASANALVRCTINEGAHNFYSSAGI